MSSKITLNTLAQQSEFLHKPEKKKKGLEYLNKKNKSNNNLEQSGNDIDMLGDSKFNPNNTSQVDTRNGSDQKIGGSRSQIYNTNNNQSDTKLSKSTSMIPMQNLKSLTTASSKKGSLDQNQQSNGSHEDQGRNKEDFLFGYKTASEEKEYLVTKITKKHKSKRRILIINTESLTQKKP